MEPAGGPTEQPGTETPHRSSTVLGTNSPVEYRIPGLVDAMWIAAWGRDPFSAGALCGSILDDIERIISESLEWGPSRVTPPTENRPYQQVANPSYLRFDFNNLHEDLITKLTAFAAASGQPGYIGPNFTFPDLKTFFFRNLTPTWWNVFQTALGQVFENGRCRIRVRVAEINGRSILEQVIRTPRTPGHPLQDCYRTYEAEEIFHGGTVLTSPPSEYMVPQEVVVTDMRRWWKTIGPYYLKNFIRQPCNHNPEDETGHIGWIEMKCGHISCSECLLQRVKRQRAPSAFTPASAAVTC